MQHQILINVIIFVAYVLNLPLNTQRSHSRSQRAGKWSLIFAHDRRPIYRAPTYIAVPLFGPHQPRYIGLTLYKARLIIETRFENSSVRRSKLEGCLILEVLGIAIWNTRFDIGVYWQWAIIGGVVVEPYFKGIQPVKRIKRVVHFIITLFWRYWTINRHQINSICRYL